MKRHESHLPNLGIVSTAVATATILGCAVSPQVVHAAPRADLVQSGVAISILNPPSTSEDSSKQLEISAFYQAAATTGGVTTLQLYVDGQQEAVKKLDSPEMRGVVSFVLPPGTLSPGEHHFVITVSATDAEVASATTSLSIAQPTEDNTAPQSDGSSVDTTDPAPAVAITAPLSQATVVGTIDIKVDAHDNSGKPPYVSLFIDHNFKTLRNFPPFDFAWDTTRVQNGYHTIEVWGYNDDQAVGHAQPLTVYVNNPSGRTTVRQDLLDTVPTRLLIKSSDLAPHPLLQHRSPAVVAPKLAQSPLHISARALKLASSQVGEFGGSSLSDETLLMAPFLHPSPTVAATASRKAPEARPTPSLAVGTAATVAVTNERIASISVDDSSLAGTSELTAPDVHFLVPSEEHPSTQSIVKVPASEPVAPVKVAPNLASQASFDSAVTLQRTPAEIGGEDYTDPTLESPSVRLQIVVPAARPTIQAPVRTPLATELPATAKAPVHAKIAPRAVLAESISKSNGTIGSVKMASASVDSSTLFTTKSSLEAPIAVLKRIIPSVPVHQVAAAVETLGSSSSGFPVRRILVGRGAYQIVMNDHTVVLTQPMQDRKSFLFAPFRQIFESQGGVLAWNGAARRVHALNGSRDIELTIGSKAATVNQQVVIMNASPYLTNGHTMIPLAFVPVALDATVDYDPASGHIVISSKE